MQWVKAGDMAGSGGSAQSGNVCASNHDQHQHSSACIDHLYVLVKVLKLSKLHEWKSLSALTFDGLFAFRLKNGLNRHLTDKSKKWERSLK